MTKKLLLTGNTMYYRNSLGTGSQTQKVAVVLELVNAQAGGLGIPLPKGIVRVYKKDKSGAEQFVGEDTIDHTPKDETLRLEVGDAFDVVAERAQSDFKAVSPRQNESAWTISIRNRKEEDVVVTVREPMGGDWTLMSSSIPGKKVDQQTLEFTRPGPGEERGEADLPRRGEVVAGRRQRPESATNTRAPDWLYKKATRPESASEPAAGERDATSEWISSPR